MIFSSTYIYTMTQLKFFPKLYLYMHKNGIFLFNHLYFTLEGYYWTIFSLLYPTIYSLLYPMFEARQLNTLMAKFYWYKLPYFILQFETFHLNTLVGKSLTIHVTLYTSGRNPICPLETYMDTSLLLILN